MHIEDLDLQTQVEKLTAALKTANETGTTTSAKLADITTKYTALQKKHQLDSLIDSFGKWKDRDAVRILIQDEFQVDEGSSLQTVNGQKPETVLKNFSIEHAYLVAGNETSESGQGQKLAGKYSVADIFGKKSSGAAANKLARENPAEYRRGKQLAKSLKLI